MRAFLTFRWKEANLRVSSPFADAAIEEIKLQRALLDEYIARCPEFLSALAPIAILPGAPEIVQRMHQAALLTGVGPMAAVAGATAQFAVEAALRKADAVNKHEAIVENGGDIFIAACDPVTIGLYAGKNPLSGKLGFHILPEQTPLSVCSSSSKMGHSLSFGDCDLATVVSHDGALADACATLTGNSVKRPEDIQPALEQAMAIPGIMGALIIKDAQVGMAGELPELIRNCESEVLGKVTTAPGVVIR